MPDSLDDIYVLPRMRQLSEKGRTYRLLWILDLVSDSSRSYINLLFQGTGSTRQVFVDTIPPELLSYCTVGSYFTRGKIVHWFPGGQPLALTIGSTPSNRIIEAREAFTDKQFNLSLDGMSSLYSNIARQQLCFVQQVNDIKVVIPCFVIAATYYFKSTSLREAILSRNLDSLFHTCTLDEKSKHAKIHLKSAGNLVDAKTIARFKLDPFANQRINICKNYHYASRGAQYRRLKVDFPVEQEIPIGARGVLKENDDGSKTFIVLRIENEDSWFPFDSIDILYQKEDGSSHGGGSGNYSKTSKKHNQQLVMRQASTLIMGHLLENVKPIVNPTAERIRERRIAVARQRLNDERTSSTVYDKDKADLSTQPPRPGDESTSKAEVRDRDSDNDKFEWSLDDFIQVMIAYLRDNAHTVQTHAGCRSVRVEDMSIITSFVPRRSGAGYVTLRESYNNSHANMRKCAYVTFTCGSHYVRLVEVDQAKISGCGCSTRILISDSEIDVSYAEDCVKDYVDEKLLSSRKGILKSEGIVLKTLNHPHNDDEATLKSWCSRLLGKILQI